MEQFSHFIDNDLIRSCSVNFVGQLTESASDIKEVIMNSSFCTPAWSMLAIIAVMACIFMVLRLPKEDK
jgi:hypothetical protein